MKTRPLVHGALWTPARTEFSLPAPEAERVQLELDIGSRSRAVELARGPDGVWRTTIPDLEPGSRYGYRVSGPWAPARGLRFNGAKLLLDPWALAVTGEADWGPELLAFADPADPDRLLDGRDDAHLVPRSVVVDPSFDWTGEKRRPPRPWSETFLYEAHVRGLTRLHPEVPPEHRGTFLGLAEDAVIEHLLALGVTAVELMPISHFVSERHLLERGLRNYWGYAPIALLAPAARYATAGDGRQVRECKEMIRRLHRAGLEVILDIVLNHTAEGGVDGLRLAWQGIEPGLYRRPADRPRRLLDYTGCGNTVDARSPTSRSWILGALRSWVEEFHVDGFRLDLAPVLGRDPGVRFTPDRSWFFREIEEDPVLSTVKWIAEPWDLGPEGYCRGRFPARVREWDDRFRDDARRFWLFGEGGRNLAGHLLGEADDPDRDSRRWIRYVAAHDGNTLLDLVSYARKHNEANGEGNRDGHGGEVRHDHGVEGPTDDPGIVARRLRARRHLIATVSLAPGVPMLGHGDELGRTQRGNNNAYCQDSELTWVDWEGFDAEWLDFVRAAFALRPARSGRRRLLDLRGRSLPKEEVAASFAIEIPPDLLLLVHGGTGIVRPGPELVRSTALLLDTVTGDAAEPGAPLEGPGLRLLRRRTS